MNTLKTVYEKIAKAEEIQSKKVELEMHNVELAKSLQELDAMYQEIVKVGANNAKYIDMLKQIVTYFNNTGKSYNILTDKFQAEVKGTIDAAKQLGLTIPANTMNNVKFVSQFKDKAKNMFALANSINSGLTKI